MESINWVPFKFTSNEMYTLSNDKMLAILQIFFFNIFSLFVYFEKIPEYIEYSS